MNKLSMLLCAALLISGIAHGHTYNEQATAQLVELLSSRPDRDDHENAQEALKEVLEKIDLGIALVKSGANPNIINPDGRNFTLLFSLVMIDFWSIVAEHGVERSTGFDISDVQAFTATIHRAIKVGLEYGANPNQCHDDGTTALFVTFSPEMARLLIDYGADRSIQDNQRHTALQTLEAHKLSLQDEIAQGKGGFLNFDKATLLDFLAHLEQVIEVLKTYKVN